VLRQADSWDSSLPVLALLTKLEKNALPIEISGLTVRPFMEY